jgi:hypothetical protein
MIARRALTEKNVKNDVQSTILFCGSYFGSFTKSQHQ